MIIMQSITLKINKPQIKIEPEAYKILYIGNVRQAFGALF